MIENFNHITDLIYRSLAEELPAGEQAELDGWLNAFIKRREWYQTLTDNGLQEAMQRTSVERITVVEDIHARIRVATGISSARDGEALVHRVHFLKTAWFKYAAAVLILISGIAVYYKYASTSPPETAVMQRVPRATGDVLPGFNRAVLTLSDGQQVTLDSAASPTIQDGTLSIENTNGQLRYKNNGVAAMNTMTTPKGGQYQLTLADGTKVWLNAASSITYPTAFHAHTREVMITGEAYFQIAKDKEKPFIVKTRTDEITVLGTSFNVNAYPDEPAMKTSLLEGSVKIGGILLKPGQAFIQGKVLATNVEQDIAWKNGYFNFNNADLPTVLKQLARWYDIEIEYPAEVPRYLFKGKLDRGLTLMEALEILRDQGIRYSLQGRTLIISPMGA